MLPPLINRTLGVAEAGGEGGRSDGEGGATTVATNGRHRVRNMKADREKPEKSVRIRESYY